MRSQDVWECDRVPIIGGTQVRWQKLTIKVPRCSGCQASQNRATTLGILTWLLGVLLGIGGCNITQSSIGGWGAFAVFAFFFIVGLAIGVGIDACVHRAAGAKHEAAKTEFPAVKKQLSEGWHVGEGPAS